MSKTEAEERVEKIKKLMTDYTRLAPLIGISQKDQERTIEIFLDDLSKALKALKEE